MYLGDRRVAVLTSEQVNYSKTKLGHEAGGTYPQYRVGSLSTKGELEIVRGVVVPAVTVGLP